MKMEKGRRARKGFFFHVRIQLSLFLRDAEQSAESTGIRFSYRRSAVALPSFLTLFYFI